MNEEFYTSSEVEKLLHITNFTLHNWRKQGKIKFIRLSPKKFLYKKSDIHDFISSNYSAAQGDE